MNVKRSSMPAIAGLLAAAIAILGVTLWIGPWKADEATTAAAGKPGAKPVKVDQKLADQGKSLSESNGCTSCHTTDGGSGAGPTWAGLWGSVGATGETVDEAYIVGILTNPPAAMANFKGKFDEEDETAIAEYIKSLAQ